MMRFVLLATCLTYTIAQRAGAGSNTYLPPNPGYDYPAPSPPGPRPPAPQPRPPAPRPPPAGGNQADHVHEPGMPFDFQYAVQDQPTQNDYSHQANSDGDVTRGEYRVALPDGRTQIVRYTADWKNGYNAEVSYEGEASYPDQARGPGAPGGGYRY